jgi:hypothetical protein
MDFVRLELREQFEPNAQLSPGFLAVRVGMVGTGMMKMRGINKNG